MLESTARWSLLGGTLVACSLGAPAWAQAAGPSLEEVTITGITPLQESPLAADAIPANVQSADRRQIARSTDLAELMNRHMGSAVVNEAQGNPLQADVQFRGFVASPLLGLPQGLAVYQNGVRINEPFGDTVNWALIPHSAIATVELIPGASPVFGLNAQGGALSIRTKDGFTAPGTSGELTAGSFERRIAQLESGGTLGNDIAWFVTGRRFEEDGWRDHSPSAATQLFGNVGWRGSAGSAHLEAATARTDLIGNGAVPIELLEADRTAIFTRPDRTENRLALVTLRGAYRWSETLAARALAYYRSSDVDTLNGDDSDYEPCEDDPAFMCEEEDEIALALGGLPIPTGPAVEGATVNRTELGQRGRGAAAQLEASGTLAGRRNELALGTALDRARMSFDSSTELGRLDDTRRAIPGGFFVEDSLVALHAATRNFSAWAHDRWALHERVALTVSGRYDRTEVELRDQRGTALSGSHRFGRFNASTGITAQLSGTVQAYAAYGESSRAPSPVELTCADEEDPCRLPNAFVSDPPLEQVITRSLEAGVRGHSDRLRWHLGVFRARNAQDILFVSAGALTNQGYFDNVGATRRQGIELNLSGRALGQRLEWSLDYTHLDATFRDRFRIASDHNPAASDGEIEVHPGDRLPGVPRQLLKLDASVALTPRFTVGANLLYSSARYFRGDEANLTAPVSGYTVIDARAEYALSERLRLTISAENVFDEHYETFGVFGEADEVLGEAFENPRFLSPGAPASAWLGVRFSL